MPRIYLLKGRKLNDVKYLCNSFNVMQTFADEVGGVHFGNVASCLYVAIVYNCKIDLMSF